MSDPDATTLILWLLILGVPMALFLLCQRKVKRNRYNRRMGDPRDDDRSSIRNFKRMTTP